MKTLAESIGQTAIAIGQAHAILRPVGQGQDPWMEIVGVVQDVKHELNLAVTPDFYLPHAQDSWNSMVLVARTKVEPGSLAADIQATGLVHR